MSFAFGTSRGNSNHIAAPQRVPDRFANVPTWKEEGANVNVSSFRMLLGAK